MTVCSLYKPCESEAEGRKVLVIRLKGHSPRTVLLSIWGYLYNISLLICKMEGIGLLKNFLWVLNEIIYK